jgi:preprotein translocase subunit SecA
MPIDYEALWDKFTDGMSAVGEAIASGLTRLLGSSNERQIRNMAWRVRAVNELAPKFRDLSDAQLKDCTTDFRRRLAEGEDLDDLLPEAFAACREASHRTLGKGKWVDDPFTGQKIPYMAHFDVQLLGGMVLHEGKIAEMVTGEGKTLVATLPAYLNALTRRGVHVVTVNDYLARRDAEWMAPIYQSLGLSVGFIQANMELSMGPESRHQAYQCDITYGTNNEFGFDYLRDNMKPARNGDPRYSAWQQQVQRSLTYAIIDEVDNILVDEARTPLIISGPATDDTTKYYKADRIARQLKRETHFEVKEKEHTCHLTDDGVRAAEKLAGVESFYTPGNMEWPHLIDQALKAHHLYHRDKEYVVMNGEVIIVDEFTGRLMHGRHWSDGLHQAVEAKEGVRIKEETQTLATITLQNFFKLYKKLAGMTGTAMTEANEFWKIYKLDVVAIPPNRPLHRENYADVIYRSVGEKYRAIVNEVEDVHRTGRPILIGTTSIENSEKLSGMLTRCGIQHQVLNAKYHEREAEIIAQAGRKHAVTIATNMAGRGTDIILGGNPEFLAWTELKQQYAGRLDVPPDVWKAKVEEIELRERMREEGREVARPRSTLECAQMLKLPLAAQYAEVVDAASASDLEDPKALAAKHNLPDADALWQLVRLKRAAHPGGLHVLGTERHEARRIDNQLRGRAGRQGDPGSARFYLSLEDDLMRIFAGEWVKAVLTRLGMQEDEAIESGMVSRRIAAAQKKVEERNFDMRKSLLEYDEVMDGQRKRVYSFRHEILDGAHCKSIILGMIDEQVQRTVERFCNPRYGTESFVEWVSSRLGAELDLNHFLGADFDAAATTARDAALEQAESLIADALEENLPSDVESEEEWNWAALTTWANNRWSLKLKERELRRLGRDDVVQFLLDQARAAIQATDLEPARGFLTPEWGLQSLCGWAQHKFGIKLQPESLAGKSSEELTTMIRDMARALYAEREIEFPVRVALARFMAEQSGSGVQRYDREGLVRWANARFEGQLSYDDMRFSFRTDFFPVLLEMSRHFYANREIHAALDHHCDALFGGKGAERNGAALDPKAIAGLCEWCQNVLHLPLLADEVARTDSKQLRRRLLTALDDRYRPEMADMERMLVLQILDVSWKDHLYVMDHLRSSVGLRGYAQVDPKVEYKREGMKLFDEMWLGVGDKVTDLIFRMEVADASFIRDTWQMDRAEAVHADVTGTGIQGQQQAAVDASSQKGEQKPEPIRHRGARVGRNEPCPCGSGKKYKSCCMRHAG